MADAPQPGRIETPQPLRGGSAGATPSAETPQQAGVDNSVRPNFRRNAGAARSLSTGLSAPKKKITGFGQAVFIGFAVVVDGTEAFLDLIAIGIILNRIIDIVVAIIFFGYAFAKGLKFGEDWKIYASIIGTIIGEFVPGVDIAPFFTLDAWYITHTLKAKDKVAEQASAEAMQSNVAEQQEQERQEWIANYQRQQQEQESAEQEQVQATQAAEATETEVA